MIKVKIIAEAGVNWSTMEEAREFIRESKRLGLFATKFQIFREENIRDSPKEYQEFLRSIMLSCNDIYELFNYGKSVGQEVFFTPMFLEAVDWCKEIGVNYYKIRCKDNQNKKLIGKILKTPYRKIIFISYSDPLTRFHKDRIKWLCCSPKYPSSIADYKKFEKCTNISDHTFSTKMLKNHRKYFTHPFADIEYWEKHVCLTKDCLESGWSCTFKELEEALKHE